MPASASPSSSASALPPRLRKCSRCDQASTLLLRGSVPSCTPCAQRAVEQRAKGILEHARGAALLDRQGGIDRLRKGKGIAAHERGGIALACSGGVSSRALLNVATRSLAPPSRSEASSSMQRRKARPVEVTRIDVIYIDNSALILGAHDQTEKIQEIVNEQGGEEAGLRFVPLKLEDVFGCRGGTMEAIECLVGPTETRRLFQAGSSKRSPRELLLSLFGKIDPPSTSRASSSSARTRSEDLQALLIQVLLVQAARSLGDAALLLGDSASRGAINLIDGIAKGRGHKWPVEGASAIWRDDLLVLRPLRDCFAKELAFYNRTLRLSYLAPRDLVAFSVLSSRSRVDGSGAGEKASIGRLTEKFIYHLEKGVPSTVNTVSRTGGKLVMAEAAEDIAPVETVLSSLSIEGGLTTTGRPTADLSLSVGTGQKGNRLVQGVKSIPRWNGNNACPLCTLPAQNGASAWKGKLSIVGSLDEQGRISKYASKEEETRGGVTNYEKGEGESIHLEKLLCYACLIVLDVPEEMHSKREFLRDSTTATAGGIAIPLPAYVFAAARSRLRVNNQMDLLAPFEQQQECGPSEKFPGQVPKDLHTSAEKEHRQDRRVAETVQGENGKPTFAGHLTRRVSPEEMRGRVGDFLLPHEDEEEDEIAE